jgi:flagellar biosynthesis protein FlhG
MATVNLADTLRTMGHTVAVIDADLGLSNCATLLNEQTDATVVQWIRGQCSMEDLPLDSDGLTLITGASKPGLSDQDMEMLFEAMDQVIVALSEYYDFIFIDTPAGSGELSLWALDRAHLGMIVLVNEPTAISDVYRFCKYVLQIDPTYPFASIVNFAESEEEAGRIHERFNTILQYFMQQQVSYLGFIPASEHIRSSIRNQVPLTRLQPRPELLKEFEYIAHNILGKAPVAQAPGAGQAVGQE